MNARLTTIRRPQHASVADRWPDAPVRLRPCGEASAYGAQTFEVLVGDDAVGKVERFTESHSMKIAGTRLSRGRSKPRTQFCLPGEPSWCGDTAGNTVIRLLRSRSD